MGRFRLGVGLAFVLLSGAAWAQPYPPPFPPPGGPVPPGLFPPGAPYGQQGSADDGRGRGPAGQGYQSGGGYAQPNDRGRGNGGYGTGPGQGGGRSVPSGNRGQQGPGQYGQVPAVSPPGFGDTSKYGAWVGSGADSNQAGGSPPR